jgi:hypothetical protein
MTRKCWHDTIAFVVDKSMLLPKKYFASIVILQSKDKKQKRRCKSISFPRTWHDMLAFCVRELHRRPRGGENIGRRFLASSSAQKGTKNVICDREGVGDRWSTDGASNTFRTHSSPHSLYPLANQEKNGGHQRENYKETVKGWEAEYCSVSKLDHSVSRECYVHDLVLFSHELVYWSLWK